MAVTLKYAVLLIICGPVPFNRAPFRGQLLFVGGLAFVRGSPRQNIPAVRTGPRTTSHSIINATHVNTKEKINGKGYYDSANGRLLQYSLAIFCFAPEQFPWCCNRTVFISMTVSSSPELENKNQSQKEQQSCAIVWITSAVGEFYDCTSTYLLLLLDGTPPLLDSLCHATNKDKKEWVTLNVRYFGPGHRATLTSLCWLSLHRHRVVLTSSCPSSNEAELLTIQRDDWKGNRWKFTNVGRWISACGWTWWSKPLSNLKFSTLLNNGDQSRFFMSMM